MGARGERHRSLRALLDQLPADQRDVLLMRVVADLSVEQTAAAIGRSAGAVKQLQRRGLIALRERVQELGHTLDLAPVVP